MTTEEKINDFIRYVEAHPCSVNGSPYTPPVVTEGLSIALCGLFIFTPNEAFTKSYVGSWDTTEVEDLISWYKSIVNIVEEVI